MESLDDLRAAAEQERLRALPGLGAKTEEKILKSLAAPRVSAATGRTLLGKALPAVRRAVAVARAQHPSVSIEASIAPELHTVADEARLESVIGELLDNACRYSPEGAPVEVSARAMSEGIVVSITDRGEGLDRTVARRSFEEPFSTGEGVLRKEKSGVGAGLHLARQLVMEHGGTLWTDPLPGGGTRAAFCIPPLDRRAGASTGAA